MTLLTLAVLGLVLAAEFVNGWTDAPNAIATVVSTRVLKPRLAVVLATILAAWVRNHRTWVGFVHHSSP